MRKLTRHLSWTLVLALTGCAPLATTETRTLDYVCEGGAGFRLTTTGDDAVIEVAGMRFGLRAEAVAGGGRTYSCNELSVHLHDDATRVDMEGRRYLDGCRPTTLPAR